jgi:septum site-determining protein MinC
MTREEPAFKIKTGNLSVLQLHIYTTDLDRIKREIASRLAQNPDFFVSTPIVLELSGIANSTLCPDFSNLLTFLRKHGMYAAGFFGGSGAQRKKAIQAGLGLFSDAAPRNNIKSDTPADQNGASGFKTPSDTQALVPLKPTLVIDKPVRTGQIIYAENASLVVLAVVNAGAELIADGDIHVYSTMRGRAIAGASGNIAARIFLNCMEAELLSIAGCFKMFEEGIPENVRSKPAMVQLAGSSLLIEPITN